MGDLRAQGYVQSPRGQETQTVELGPEDESDLDDFESRTITRLMFDPADQVLHAFSMDFICQFVRADE